ncbi:MAG: hypothetical protein ACTSV1_07185 [Alphaproteobacteria bacterium]
MVIHTTRPRWVLAVAIFAGVFGILTLKSGGEVLFIDGAGREAAGNYLPFVVWFNFLAGFAYIAGAVGLAMWRPWASRLAFAIAALTIAVSVAFGIHILMDGAFEMRTVGALALRSLVWLGIYFAVRGKIPKAGTEQTG